MLKLLVALSLTLSLLTACGGGGGGSASSVITPPPQNVQYSGTSYENAKSLSFYSATIPQGETDSLASSFFLYKDGTRGLITNSIVYNATLQTPQTATPSRLTFWKYVNNAWVANSIVDAGQVPNCIHPRKSLAVDINNDGQLDFVILCHGFDAAPYPGEKSRVVLSQPNGRYIVDYMSSDIQFFHGGSAADLNGDGKPDLLTNSSNGIVGYINDGTGHFVVNTDYSVPNLSGVFSIELVDVNGDGKVDLLYGGHEWSVNTTLVINPGNSKFSQGIATVIPAMPAAGVVLDFVYTAANNSLYVLRTGGDASMTTFYQGVYIEKYSLSSLTSTTALGNSSLTWTPWIVNNSGNITTNWGSVFSILVQ
jgi:hypothetical protein